MYSLIQHDLTWDGGIGHCAKDNTNSVFKNMDIDSEKICMANCLVTTVLLQNIDVATLHMARVPHGPGSPCEYDASTEALLEEVTTPPSLCQESRTHYY